MSNVNAVTPEEGWNVAEQLVGSLGPLSSLYTASVRAVRSAPAILQSEAEERIKKFSLEAVGFPVKVSPTFKAAFYFLAEELDEEELQKVLPLNYLKLLNMFSPDEMIAVLSLTYIYRLMSRRCDYDEWLRLVPKLSVHMQVGHLVGERIPNVGSGHGMFIAGSRYLSLAILLYKDLKSFKELRRKCETDNKLFDLTFERELWGCNHLQVASFLVSALGYGVGPRLAFGVNTDSPVFGPLQAAVDDAQAEIDGWRTAIALTESLHAFGSTPEYLRNNGGALDSTIVTELERRSVAMVAKGQGFQWIHKIVNDLPDDIRLQLGIRNSGKKQSEDSGSSQAADDE